MKNNFQCKVYIWDKLVGNMTLVENKIYFRYDKGFDMEISPLSLPLSQAQYEFNEHTYQYSVAGVFSDSLPDSFGMNIIKKYFEKEYDTYNPNTLDKLLFIGDVSLGALSYKPAIGSKSINNIPIKLKDTKEYEKEILSKNTYSSVREVIDMYKSFSPAGGAKQKMILSYNEDQENFYIGVAKNDDLSLIIKIDESEKAGKLPDSTIEYIYSKIAKKCGLNIPNTYLFEDENGFKHFAVERFDIDDNKERLHVHTLAGLLNLEKSTRIDYEKFMFIAKKHLFVKQEDIEEIYRRMIFNYIYNNNDDHLKNHSFIMDQKGKWSLSPAYDLMYNNTKGQRDLMMSINGKLSSEVSYDDFKLLAKKYKIKEYKNIINKIQNSIKDYESMINEELGDEFRYDKMSLLDIRELKNS